MRCIFIFSKDLIADTSSTLVNVHLRVIQSFRHWHSCQFLYLGWIVKKTQSKISQISNIKNCPKSYFYIISRSKIASIDAFSNLLVYSRKRIKAGDVYRSIGLQIRAMALFHLYFMDIFIGLEFLAVKLRLVLTVNDHFCSAPRERLHGNSESAWSGSWRNWCYVHRYDSQNMLQTFCLAYKSWYYTRLRVIFEANYNTA